ncbi:hypothetical protein HK102_012282, partial [Quaeritorhiza haematococci]
KSVRAHSRSAANEANLRIGSKSFREYDLRVQNGPNTARKRTQSKPIPGEREGHEWGGPSRRVAHALRARGSASISSRAGTRIPGTASGPLPRMGPKGRVTVRRLIPRRSVEPEDETRGGGSRALQRTRRGDQRLELAMLGSDKGAIAALDLVQLVEIQPRDRMPVGRGDGFDPVFPAELRKSGFHPRLGLFMGAEPVGVQRAEGVVDVQKRADHDFRRDVDRQPPGLGDGLPAGLGADAGHEGEEGVVAGQGQLAEHHLARSVVRPDLDVGDDVRAHRPASGGEAVADGDDGDAVAVGEGDDVGLVDDDGAVGLDGEDPAAGLVEVLDGGQADGGDVEPHVLLGLGHLHEGPAPGAAELAGAFDAAVGPLDGLDRQGGLLLDGDRLADVQA